MGKNKQQFIIDNDLGPALKDYLPGKSRRAVECGLRPNAPDYPDVVRLCQRSEAMLVTADTEFPKHFARYQREHNVCCRGIVLLPSEELKQIKILAHYRGFRFDKARQANLCLNLRANPPEAYDLCDCPRD